MLHPAAKWEPCLKVHAQPGPAASTEPARSHHQASFGPPESRGYTHTTRESLRNHHNKIHDASISFHIPQGVNTPVQEFRRTFSTKHPRLQSSPIPKTSLPLPTAPKIRCSARRFRSSRKSRPPDFSQRSRSISRRRTSRVASMGGG